MYLILRACWVQNVATSDKGGLDLDPAMAGTHCVSMSRLLPLPEPIK